MKLEFLDRYVNPFQTRKESKVFRKHGVPSKYHHGSMLLVLPLLLVAVPRIVSQSSVVFRCHLIQSLDHFWPQHRPSLPCIGDEIGAKQMLVAIRDGALPLLVMHEMGRIPDHDVLAGDCGITASAPFHDVIHVGFCVAT